MSLAHAAHVAPAAPSNAEPATAMEQTMLAAEAEDHSSHADKSNPVAGQVADLDAVDAVLAMAVGQDTLLPQEVSLADQSSSVAQSTDPHAAKAPPESMQATAVEGPLAGLDAAITAQSNLMTTLEQTMLMQESRASDAGWGAALGNDGASDGASVGG